MGKKKLLILPFNFGVQVVKSGEENVFRKRKGPIEIPHGYTLTRIHTFIGTRTGDMGEYSIDIGTLEGEPIYTRSFHKEGTGLYESWDVKNIPDVTLSFLWLEALIRCTKSEGDTVAEIEIRLEMVK
jgi:hypothetical protein